MQIPRRTAARTPLRGKVLALRKSVREVRDHTRGGYLYTTVNPAGAELVPFWLTRPKLDQTHSGNECETWSGGNVRELVTRNVKSYPR